LLTWTSDSQAYWVSLDIRFILGALAVSWLSGLPKDNKHTKAHERLWSTFAFYLYESMIHDADDAAHIAQETSSHRQALQCLIYRQRSKFFMFQFHYQMCLRGTPAGNVLAAFKSDVESHLQDFESATRDARAAYLRELPEQYASRIEWLSTNWDPSVAKIKEAWESIRTAINGGVFYGEVSPQEMASVVKALGFGTFHRKYLPVPSSLHCAP
jgi:hypothetical protein